MACNNKVCTHYSEKYSNGCMMYNNIKYCKSGKYESINFIALTKQMCKTQTGCSECPLNSVCDDIIEYYEEE